MSEANVNDRASIERIYPREAFEKDAGENSSAKAEVLHGVRIESGADASGRFRLVPAAQHVGEHAGRKATLFLSPMMVESAASLVDDGRYGGPVETGRPVEKGRDYDGFIDGIIEAARRFEPPPAPDRNDERLKGFRGG